MIPIPLKKSLIVIAFCMARLGVRAHLAGRDDELVTVKPALDQLPSFRELLKTECGDAIHNLNRSERTGRPAGAEEFVLGLERLLRRPLARRSPGRKPASVIIEKQAEPSTVIAKLKGNRYHVPLLTKKS